MYLPVNLYVCETGILLYVEVLLRHIVSSKTIPIPLFHLKKSTDPIFEIFSLKCLR